MKILLIFMFLISCSTKPPSIGQDNEVLVFISDKDREMLEPFIYDLFDEVYITPQQEKEFKVKFKSPIYFNKFLKHPNIFCISIKSPKDSTGDVLTMHLLKEQKNNPIIMFHEPYARHQSLIVINELDASAAIASLSDNKEWIISELRETYSTRILNDLLKNDRNNEIEDQIREFFGINMIVPEDYEIININNENSFLWIGDDYPYKWIMLYKEKNDKFNSPKSALDDISTKLNLHAKSISILETSKRFKVYNDSQKELKSISGLYEHTKQLTGGPFYAFFYEGIDSTIVMLSMVNNPGKEKLFYLKQFEVIFKSINQNY